MTQLAMDAIARTISVDEIFPHSPALLWQALTNPALMGRWLMVPSGFEPVVGNRFTYNTTPAGNWDGTIRCEVIEVVPERRLGYSWRGGDAANVGYGSLLDTVVMLTLTPVAGGTRLSVAHSGFQERNESAYCKMSEGWPKVLKQVGAVADGLH